MDLDGADNPWADAPPSNSTSRDHLPPVVPVPDSDAFSATGTAKLSLSAVTGDFGGGGAFAAAFPTPSPTASASNSFTPPTSSSSYSAATTADPTSIPLPMSATSPNNSTHAQDGMSNAFASLTLGQDNAADQAAAADAFSSAFAMSAPPAPAPVAALTSLAADPFGFGSFDAPSSAPAPAPAPAPAASSSQSNADADLFGDFGGAPTQAPPSNAFAFADVSNDAGAESDGFGDFADFATGDANAANNHGDDDFGDFGDFETSTTTADLAPRPAAPAPAPIAAAAASTPPPATNAAPLAPILHALVSGTSLPVTGVFDLQSYLASADPSAAAAPAASPVPQLHIPLVHTAPDGSCYPRVSMNPVFAASGTGSGYDDIQRLAEAPLFDEHISTRIRWRKCLVKKMFQAALEMPVDWDDKGDKPKVKAGAAAPTISTSAAPSTSAPALAAAPAAAAAPPAPTHTLSPITPLPDLATLTALATLTEDDLRARSDAELAHVQGVLASAVPGLHAQINYYLDAREQLALDAEMHNKMISVLVQQAQKSHGRFAKKGSPPKRK